MNLRIKQKLNKIKTLSRSVDLHIEKKMNMTNYFKDYKKSNELGLMFKSIENPIFH